MDPLQDAIAWIRGLRSPEVSKKLLADRHGHTRAYVNDAARAIASHSSSALDLVEQAMAGPSWHAFLPLYYAMLHLAKVVVIFDGGLTSLQTQRTHGASWTGIHRKSLDIMTDHVTLHERGALALFYRTLTSCPWPSSAQKDRSGNWISTKKRKIELRRVYPTIASIGYEYMEAYGQPTMLDKLSVTITPFQPNKPGQTKWHVIVQFDEPVTRKHHFTAGLSRGADKRTFTTAPLAAVSEVEARRKFEGRLRWHLLHHTLYGGSVRSFTPASAINIQMPQEFAILLAFFHLSNVVRYDPERLLRMVDSKACSMLDSARRHAVLDYFLAIWSFINQRTVLFVR